MKRQPRPNRASAGWSQLKIVIVIAIVIISVVGFETFSRLAQNRDYAHALICASHVKAIGRAIAEFAHEHNGKLPTKLEDISSYEGSNKILFCPSAKDRAHYSYVLTGATNVWGVSTNTIILIEVERNHYGGRHVLFDDGRVELRAFSDH